MAAGSSISRFETAAVTLAEHGYHIFPCRSRGKEPLTRNGFHDSSRDERRILHWWDNIADANIGIDCGASGIVVLDIDSKSGADPADILAERDLHGAPIILTGEAPERDAKHPRSLAGVRGAQVYFRGTLRTTNRLAIPGTELRGVGGYVIAPPSVHPSGVEYLGQLPAVTQLPEVPDWLHELAVRDHTPAEPVNGKVRKGEQHHTLVSLAGTMRRRGMEVDAIDAALQVVNRTQLEDPAPPGNIRAIAESVAQYAPGDAVNATKSVQMNPDAASAAAALAELLALDTVNVRVRAARIYGKGSIAAVEIDLSNDETMNFGSLREMMRPQTLIAEVAACTGATPALKQVQCAVALTLVRDIASVVEVDTENDIAREWGRDFLELAGVLDLDLANQAERWRAFELLAEREPWGRSGGDGRETMQPLVLRDINGARFVRTLWFERYVKGRDSSATRGVIGARMARVGWHRRGKHGDIKATAPGFRDVRIYPFWVIPADWGVDQEQTA